MDKLNPKFVLTKEYSAKSFLEKFVFYMLSAALHVRAKYYSGFKMSEASVIFSGLAYERIEIVSGDDAVKKQEQEGKLPSRSQSTSNVYNSNSKNDNNNNDNNNRVNNIVKFEETFDKIRNMDIIGFEFDVNPIDKINVWNCTVHKWLKYQVFLRLINVETRFFKNNKSRASMITFLISAVWHGFYPVYYVFFIHLYMIEQASKSFEEKINFFSKIKRMSLVVRLIFNFVLMGVMCVLGLSFSLLTISNIVKFYSDFYFIPNAIVFLVYVYSVYFLKRPRENMNKHN